VRGSGLEIVEGGWTLLQRERQARMDGMLAASLLAIFAHRLEGSMDGDAAE
jgi:hypothetical protein